MHVSSVCPNSRNFGDDDGVPTIEHQGEGRIGPRKKRSPTIKGTNDSKPSGKEELDPSVNEDMGITVRKKRTGNNVSPYF